MLAVPTTKPTVTVMPAELFILSVFCLIDDLYLSLITEPLRKHGALPKLADSEAIAIEITGEWLGFHNDKAIWKYFKNHWFHLFPNLPVRSQFVRQTRTTSPIESTFTIVRLRTSKTRGCVSRESYGQWCLN